ncbi:YqjF family protein [Flagellimonas myxillae]|uniref:YqjF family protein n=1 Tax=Flagellimonas myxillae TaxID=2942214 RepID=UPI00201E95AF|nr:DUF2071 domain-containing protein [Muricauda myxillae]MCL6265019.1 DUF2071 domain-containing protein [Muricauda myxillae]
MKIREILEDTDHRPWALPTESWKFYQEWNKVVFLHWAVDFEILKQFVPANLELELFEGKPWVSVVIFRMEQIRPKTLPSFPPISNFHEVNIRTYAKHGNKTGVYFLSIEGGNPVSCLVARKMSQLPYRFSQMQRDHTHFSSYNREFQDQLAISYQVGKAITTKTALDLWLTERYALFQDFGQHLNAFEIHHVEWPVYELHPDELTIQYPRFSALFSFQPDLVHYSPGVQVVAWDKKTTHNFC